MKFNFTLNLTVESILLTTYFRRDTKTFSQTNYCNWELA